MKIILLCILAVAMIGLMVPSVYAEEIHSLEFDIGDSRILEKDCKTITQEIDNFIDCRVVLKNHPISSNISPFYYDSSKNTMYFGEPYDYIEMEMENFTITSHVQCEPVVTGTYVKKTNYPCELDMKSNMHNIQDNYDVEYFMYGGDFLKLGKKYQKFENVIFLDTKLQKITSLGDSYFNEYITVVDSKLDLSKHLGSPDFVKLVRDYHFPTWHDNNPNWFVESTTKTPYAYILTNTDETLMKLAVFRLNTFSFVHEFKTFDNLKHAQIFYNENKNEIYLYSLRATSTDDGYWMDNTGGVIYVIQGFGYPALSFENFIEPGRDPEYYFKKYWMDETYKEWFDTTYPGYKIHDATGISSDRGLEIMQELRSEELTWLDQKETLHTNDPEPKTESTVESDSTDASLCGEGTTYKNGQCVLDERESGGGCLIATAAFGSEMAPQVQFLREIRDGTVMSTQSGTAFMTGFNQFYYSFSPAIADYERENPVFKEAVKVSLTPLLTSLTLLNYVNVDTEVEMLGYGIGIIVLNVGMYFVAPAILVISIKNRLKK